MNESERRRPGGRRGLSPADADRLVAVLVFAVTAAGTGDQVAHWLPRYSVAVFGLAQGALVLARRRAPLAVLLGTAAIATFMIAEGYAAGSAGAGALAATYAVAAYPTSSRHLARSRRSGSLGRPALPGSSEQPARPTHPEDPANIRPAEVSAPFFQVGCIVLAAGAPAAAMLMPGSRTDGMGVWPPLAVVLFFAVAWISGYAVRTRRAYVGQLEERAARLEREQGELAARAVADERLRIARELHDVIGHSISLITIQSEAAARSARTNPEAVPGFLATISATSREALAELRHVLAVLRPAGPETLDPQPGLDALTELVARVEAAGLPVQLDVQPQSLPAGVGLAVYRIVQEALTNVLRHAGPATASVTVARAGGMLQVSVLDDGAGPAGLPVPPTAHGIIGMRERVAVYGGTLHTGRRPGGGFEVRATLPSTEEAA